jgi:hypothetical protein
MALPRKQLQFRNGAHTVDDNDDRVEREALLERLDLLQQRLRITRIAGKHRDARWAAARIGEQKAFDPRRARLAVARIAARGQRTAAPVKRHQELTPWRHEELTPWVCLVSVLEG